MFLSLVLIDVDCQIEHTYINTLAEYFLIDHFIMSNNLMSLCLTNHTKIMLADPMNEDRPARVKAKWSIAKDIIYYKEKVKLYVSMAELLYMYISLTKFCVSV